MQFNVIPPGQGFGRITPHWLCLCNSQVAIKIIDKTAMNPSSLQKVSHTTLLSFEVLFQNCLEHLINNNIYILYFIEQTIDK